MFSLLAVTNREQGDTFDEFINKTAVLETRLLEEAQNGSLQYTPVHNVTNKPSMTELVVNIVHGIYYNIIIETNTVLYIASYYTYKYVPYNVPLFIIKWILILSLIWIINKSVMPIGVFYVFLEDYFKKRNMNLNRWLVLLLSSFTWIVILSLMLWIGYLIFW